MAHFRYLDVTFEYPYSCYKRTNNKLCLQYRIKDKGVEEKQLKCGMLHGFNFHIIANITCSRVRMYTNSMFHSL